MKSLVDSDDFSIQGEYRFSFMCNLKFGIVAKFDCVIALRTISFKYHNVRERHVCGSRVLSTAVMSRVSVIQREEARGRLIQNCCGNGMDRDIMVWLDVGDVVEWTLL